MIEKLRQRQSGRAEAAYRCVARATRVPAAGHGGLLQGNPGPSERDCREEPAVQEDQGQPRRVHEGSAVLHADRGELLRQLFARQNAQGVKCAIGRGGVSGWLAHRRRAS